jgi:putative membrane protein insertion efficiency factor
MTVGRLLSALLVGGIRGYQRFISPLSAPRCRYYPSCSAYALGAVRTHGPVKGFLLAVWRLLRCNPWSQGGIDHVPDRGSWRGGHDVRPAAERVGS